MLTQETINKWVEELNAHADEVTGDNDEIMTGLIRHLVRNIDADLTQLWFYAEALKARKGIGRSYGLTGQELSRLLKSDLDRIETSRNREHD